MKTLHFDCFAGISGDMTLGAFIDLGIDQEILKAELGKLGIDGWNLSFQRDERCGITGTRAIVEIENSENPKHTHSDHHDTDHAHPHEHAHEHHGEVGHSHNSWKEIRTLIERSSITANAKTRALDIFTRIAIAEAQVHGVEVENVTFHEVGAIDSIIDIAGAAICLDLMNPDRVTASEIELGGGTVTCTHGILPVPAPATLLLCKGLPVTTGGFQKEMTTPTGAAILASCVDEFVSRASFTQIKTGYGIGTRKMDKPNVLRLSIREEIDRTAPQRAEPWNSEELVMIEANIDDMSGESLAFLMERLFDTGALDVTFTPCTMKKSRPGTIVSALCTQAKLNALRRCIFEMSTTIGFRESIVRRLSLSRQESRLTGDFGEARVKRVYLEGKEIRSKIEYEDRARLARERNISLDEAERSIAKGEKNT